uniref:Ig-like domain-containing protein n=1 Tax=Cyprinus carpio TaxID=7962 RepID=A0A8C1YE90_CYPCA
MCTWNVSMFRVLISAAALLTSEGLLVQGPAQPLVAQLGGSIILPCSVETPLPVEELEVEWKRTDEEALVHLFQDGLDRPEAQYQSYKDRAHFFSEQIFKGNFSILLENITVADTGLYRCVVYSYQDVGEISVTIQHVERVVVTGKDQIILARVGEDVVLNCMVDSHIPPQRFDEVSWKKVDKSPDIIPVLLFQNGTIFSGSSHKRYIDRAEFFREEIPKGNFSIRLKNVQTADKGEYMCEVHTEKSVNSATVEIQRLGMSALHIIILMLCFTSLLLTFLLSIPVTIYINRKDTGTKPMYINYLQVVCPNICLSIAFVLWGVIEGSVVEVTMCATINLSRIILLFLMAPYFNWNTTVSVDLPVSFHRIIEYMGIPIAYLLISTAFCSAVLHDLWNASKWSEVVLVSAVIILLSSTPVFLRALSEVCFTHFFEIHFSLGFVTSMSNYILLQFLCYRDYLELHQEKYQISIFGFVLLKSCSLVSNALTLRTLILYSSGSQSWSWRTPNTAHFRCLPIHTHLIQLISSLGKTPRPQMCVSDKRDTRIVQCWGFFRTRIGNHCCTGPKCRTTKLNTSQRNKTKHAYETYAQKTLWLKHTGNQTNKTGVNM